MKDQKLSFVINQINTLLLTVNTLMCENGIMENVEKKYGFYLLKIESDKYKSGFYYAVRYKDPDTKKWIPTKKSTDTDDEILAKAFAIENKDAIIHEYKERKKIRQEKNNGTGFYRMLREYYQKGSKYLQDDKNKTGEDLTFQQRGIYGGFVNRLLIPFLQGENINSIQDITTDIYSKLKNHLQEQTSKKGGTLSKKTCNNYLQGLVRILEYHKRHKQIQEFPYELGEALIKLAKGDKVRQKKPGILPTNKLCGILQNNIFFTKKPAETPDVISYLLAMIGLTTGMRNSEIGRLRRKDIKSVKGENGYYANVFNHKTDAHNISELEEYRKMPLHPFIVGMLKEYIEVTGKGGNDYLFGEPKADKDTGEIDGYLNAERFEKAIALLYRQIKTKEILQTGSSIEKALEFISSDAIEKEMKEKRITFYSLRHTFQTMLAMRYPGQSLLIDYFMGHKPGSAMMANYLHINKADNIDFWNEYGKLLIEFQEQFIPTKLPKEIHEANKKYVDDAFEANKHLLNEYGTIDINDALEKIINPHLAKFKTTDSEVTDDFFDCV